jgi:trimeric autotransporter adhesin
MGPGEETSTSNAEASIGETGTGETSAGEVSTSAGGADTTVDETNESGIEPNPECGNGIVEAGEECDDVGESASCNADCSLATCGDGVLNPVASEACDGSELGDATCESLGFGGGTLGCFPDCSYDMGGCANPPAPTTLSLSFSEIKRFDFSWGPVAGADYYQLLESPAPGDPFAQIGEDMVDESVSLEMPLHRRFGASYVIRACNALGCADSAGVEVVDSMVDAIGYVKASNTEANDAFGTSVALSDDGSTLAVGASGDGSDATGIDGDQTSNGASGSGAVYVFVRDGAGGWSQQAYVKASNTEAGDSFGDQVALSGDGNTLVVGAQFEDGAATGVDGDQANNAATSSGAVYVFVRDGVGSWSQQAYVKASNTGYQDFFGCAVAVSEGGDTMAVGARWESSDATGIDGNQGNNNATLYSGAVYVFVRDGMGDWSQQAYVKASNTALSDLFGTRLALSNNGDTLVVGAPGEDSNATGVGGAQLNDNTNDSGAAYVFVRNGAGIWSQQAYIKASNTGINDNFGAGIAMAGDGDTLAVGAPFEDSGATGIDGDQLDGSQLNSGAAYVFVRNGAGVWSQQAYVKASDTAAGDRLGFGLVLSEDGSVLATGADFEDSDAIGIEGDPYNDLAFHAGAVYVFDRDGAGIWSQRSYVKASNTGEYDRYGLSLALSGDGNTLAVGTSWEDGSATGIGGDADDDSMEDAGAVYLY